MKDFLCLSGRLDLFRQQEQHCSPGCAGKLCRVILPSGLLPGRICRVVNTPLTLFPDDREGP
jgi:hypothetical protein